MAFLALKVSVTGSRTRWPHPFSSADCCSIVSLLCWYDLINVSKFTVQSTCFPGYYNGPSNRVESALYWKLSLITIQPPYLLCVTSLVFIPNKNEITNQSTSLLIICRNRMCTYTYYPGYLNLYHTITSHSTSLLIMCGVLFLSLIRLSFWQVFIFNIHANSQLRFRAALDEDIVPVRQTQALQKLRQPWMVGVSKTVLHKYRTDRPGIILYMSVQVWFSDDIVLYHTNTIQK